ncbi:hypothetical protein TNCV_5015191 [Trichonephila clavipes]|nr:hypothetical protein TNCV_5015191 [Trichonephila clavipes]
MTNQHRAWSCKLRLVGGNWEDDEPDELSGQTNANIWSDVQRLVKAWTNWAWNQGFSHNGDLLSFSSQP